MTATAALPLLHTAVIPLRWGDVDSFGHLNNVMYLRLIEQARVEWLTTLEIPLNPHDDKYVVVAHLACNFRVEIGYPGSVEIRSYLQKVGRTSIGVYQEIRLAGDDTLRADCHSTLVFRSSRLLSSIPVPDSIRCLLPAESGAG